MTVYLAGRDPLPIPPSNRTYWFEFIDGKLTQVYPCRCGEKHVDLGIYIRHQCYHHEVLRDKEIPSFGLCPDCGETFEIGDM
jgi:hypothetical protein